MSPYNPCYTRPMTSDAFPEGFVFECPYHPGGPIAVTTHRGYLGALRATVHCTHNGCGFSAYDDGTVSTPSQCPTARSERGKEAPGYLKPGTRIPFHSLIYRRKWTPHQADSHGRVVIPADIYPVMERCPGAPVPQAPSKSPGMYVTRSTATHAAVTAHHQNSNTDKPSPPSSMDDRGSSCFGNNIGHGTAWRKIPKDGAGTTENGRTFLSISPSTNNMSIVDRYTAENPYEKQFLMQTVPTPPPRDKQPPRMDESIKWAEDDYVNVPRSPEKATLPRRWQTLRNFHYRDAHNSNVPSTSGSIARSGSESIQYPKTPPLEYPSRADKMNKDGKNPNSTLKPQDGRPNEPAAGGQAEDLSAESIANLVLRLAEIPERLNALEKLNEATSKSLEAKNEKIKHLEQAIDAAKHRERNLEEIIATYEQVGHRHQFSALT